jgi:hypothetical protein
MTHQRKIKQKKVYNYFIIVMEPTDERLAMLEKRVADLEELLNLLLNLKQRKVDFSNFTCEPLKLGTTR